MARGGSRASRRMGRNARAVQKMLRGKGRKGGFKEPKTPAVAKQPVNKLRKNVKRGKSIRKRSLRSEHRKAISAGMKRYWQTKRKRAQRVRQQTLSRPSSIGQR